MYKVWCWRFSPLCTAELVHGFNGDGLRSSSSGCDVPMPFIMPCVATSLAFFDLHRLLKCKQLNLKFKICQRRTTPPRSWSGSLLNIHPWLNNQTLVHARLLRLTTPTSSSVLDESTFSFGSLNYIRWEMCVVYITCIVFCIFVAYFLFTSVYMYDTIQELRKIFYESKRKTVSIQSCISSYKYRRH